MESRGGRRARTLIPEYYNYDEVEKFEQSALGIHEKMEGLHDDYYISAIIAVHDLNGVRLPERIKAGQGDDQRRQPGAGREDDRERQEDRGVSRRENDAAVKKSIAGSR